MQRRQPGEHQHRLRRVQQTDAVANPEPACEDIDQRRNTVLAVDQVHLLVGAITHEGDFRQTPDVECFVETVGHEIDSKLLRPYPTGGQAPQTCVQLRAISRGDRFRAKLFDDHPSSPAPCHRVDAERPNS